MGRLVQGGRSVDEQNLDSQQVSGSDQSRDQAAGETPGGLQGRFRNPLSADLDLASNLNEEEEAISQLAKRFRSPGLRLEEAEAPSLDAQEEEADELSEDELQGFLLDALEGAPELDYELEEFQAAGHTLDSPRRRETSVVDPPKQPAPPAADVISSAPTPQGVVCGSCQAANPPGMRFCVQCGGSLKPVVASAAPRPKPAPPSAAAREPNPWDIQLISINEDGSDGSAIALKFLETTLGADGDTRFPTDAFLSPSHARLFVEDGELYIKDLNSLNGTFLKLNAEIRLKPGDAFLMGRQVLRFERFEQPIRPKTKSPDGTRYMGSPVPGGNFKIIQVGIGNITQNVYCLPASGAVLGREKGDIIFPNDKFMSSRHAQIYQGEEGHCHLVDLNSSNGTWIKLMNKTRLRPGDHIFMGQQLFRAHITEK